MRKFYLLISLVLTIFLLSAGLAINAIAKTPDQTPTGLNDVCQSIVTERGKFPTGVITRVDIKKILTEVAKSNNTNGWGMLSKNAGANCAGVSCDIMFHGPTCYIYDVLGSATGEGETGGIATPTCDFVEGNMDRGRWVGVGADTRGSGDCAGVTPPEPTAPPTITSFSPTTAPPGSTIEVIGTNLPDKVTITNASGTPSAYDGTIGNATLTSLTFQLSQDAVDGEYSLSVESSKGKATANGKLTIKAGGSSFTGRSLPGIPEGYMGLDQLLMFFLNWSKYILGIAVFMMVFYGGVKWFFSQGNPSQISEAQGIIKNAAIGAILLLSAYLILYTVNPDLVNGTFTLPGVKSVPPTGGGEGDTASCNQQFGGTPSSGCSQASTCIDVSNYTADHDCSSNGGKCLLSQQSSNKLKAFIEKFNSLGGSNCSLKLSSTIQGSSGPSVSTCHKPGNVNSGTCADFNISSYTSCAPIFYKAAEESRSIVSFLDEYVTACKPANATGGNIHVNF